jgi:cytoskeleton protein RodZ
MPTLGEELKRRREERQITLSEISEATRIGIRFLKAIDSDNYSVLPGGIFTRSFIRAYAREIGMDDDEAISLYNQQITPPASEAGPATSGQQAVGHVRASKSSSKKPPSIVYAPEPERPRSSSISRTPTRTNWGTILIAVGILIIIGVVVTALVRQLNKASEEKAAQTANSPAPQPAEPPQQTPPSQGPSQPPATTPSSPSPAGSATPTPEAPTVTPAEAIVVKLEAIGDAWIRYQVDEGQPSQMILKTGQAQEIPPAQSAVKLNYGNRQSLKLTINNREASFPADAPKFKSQVVISRDNLQSFFQPPVPPSQ